MGVVVAGSFVVGSDVVKKAEDISASRTGEGSFESLKQKLHNLPAPKVRVTDDTLIQYKESAFLSDMLSSSKD